jgi:hypothetical protein
MFVDYINTKAKALVVFLSALSALAILVSSTLIAASFGLRWEGLAIGIVLMILAIPFHKLAKKLPSLYVVSFLMNSIASGFSVSTYYAYKDISPDLFALVIAVLPAGAMLALAYLMVQAFPRVRSKAFPVTALMNIVLLVIAIVFWIRTGWVVFSFGFFALLLSLFYLCVFRTVIDHDERSILKDISFGSFGSFVILTVVVVVILSEGDILEIGSFDFGSSKRKQKSR